MSIFLTFSISIILFLFIGMIMFFFFAWSAKKTLLKGQSSWSAKKIPIKRKNMKAPKEISSSLLEQISVETSDYLDSREDLI